jgi:hypothetical protein
LFHGVVFATIHKPCHVVPLANQGNLVIQNPHVASCGNCALCKKGLQVHTFGYIFYIDWHKHGQGRQWALLLLLKKNQNPQALSHWLR